MRGQRRPSRVVVSRRVGHGCGSSGTAFMLPKYFPNDMVIGISYVSLKISIVFSSSPLESDWLPFSKGLLCHLLTFILQADNYFLL